MQRRPTPHLDFDDATLKATFAIETLKLLNDSNEPC